MGCYATRDPATVGEVARRHARHHRQGEAAPRSCATSASPKLPAGITRFDDHQRAFVKVQDGCLLNCTYCIIPSVRPVLRSRPPEEIAREVAELVAGGYPEIVLTGVHLGHYGLDLSKGQAEASNGAGCGICSKRSTRLPGDFRVRLSSLEAAEARDDLVRTMAESPRVVPHLHLCLQSGSDRILRADETALHRGRFLERCRRLREALDAPAFTTDVIVGFPGETDADFEATLPGGARSRLRQDTSFLV